MKKSMKLTGLQYPIVLSMQAGNLIEYRRRFGTSKGYYLIAHGGIGDAAPQIISEATFNSLQKKGILKEHSVNEKAGIVYYTLTERII